MYIHMYWSHIVYKKFKDKHSIFCKIPNVFSLKMYSLWHIRGIGWVVKVSLYYAHPVSLLIIKDYPLDMQQEFMVVLGLVIIVSV